ncbi:MAG: tyrosine-type recombinase/integrase [Verrucomicrobiia bacterium]
MKTKRPFVKVKDASRRPVRGLYQRNQSLYVRFAWEGRIHQICLKDFHPTINKTTGKYEWDTTAAKLELARLKKEGPNEKLVLFTFSEIAEHYLADQANKKEKTTMAMENFAVRGSIVKHFGSKPIAKITPADIEDFRTARLAQGRSKSTVNGNVILLRNIFRHAISRGALRVDPTANIHHLKFKREEAEFVPFEHIKKVTDWIRANQKVGDLIADAILFLAFSGARFTGGMNVEWKHINWDQQKVCIPINKNGKPYWVDFNPNLLNHLTMLRQKRGGNPTGLLFPTYRTPTEAEQKPFKNLRVAMVEACVKLNLPRFTPHSLRHHFASVCIISGIDFKQTAAWLGHSDGGVLVAQVYGHIPTGHGATSAAKLPTY